MLPSSLPGHDGPMTDAASNCIEKLTADAPASNPSFRGLRGDESRRRVKHAHAQHHHPRLSPGDSPGDAHTHAQSAPPRGARSPPFPFTRPFMAELVTMTTFLYTLDSRVRVGVRGCPSLVFCAILARGENFFFFQAGISIKRTQPSTLNQQRHP